MCFAPPTECTFSTSQLQKCFAPQRRALFRHLNFQKVVRSWRVLYILTYKCASRHNGVQFFISHLASWLRTRRFSEITFPPSGAPNHWKNTVNRDFPTFSRTCIFLLLTLSLLWSSHFLTSPPWLFPPLLFHLSIFSEVWLLHFLRPPHGFLNGKVVINHIDLTLLFLRFFGRMVRAQWIFISMSDQSASEFLAWPVQHQSSSPKKLIAVRTGRMPR